MLGSNEAGLRAIVRVGIAAALFAALSSPAVAIDSGALQTADLERGRAVYDFYCYQCHGYSGDARTLASTYLNPAPRDFVHAGSTHLSEAAMLDAITSGRKGTAMMSFSKVLSLADRQAVVAFIRQRFMRPGSSPRRYHTAANGWTGIEDVTPAIPFATGQTPLDVPWEDLNGSQQAGKRLYMRTCISCHDRATVLLQGPVWSRRALSYPYPHEEEHEQSESDAGTPVSAFSRHDVGPTIEDLDPYEQSGEQLFQANCAFCHATDGTGRNWIGSFLEPNARDLGLASVAAMSDAKFVQTIKDGLPGTSMPAWKHVLRQRDIEAVVAYIRRAFSPVSRANPLAQTREHLSRPKPPTWRRQPR